MRLVRAAMPSLILRSVPTRDARRRALTALAVLPLAACMTRRRDPLADIRVLLAPSGKLHVGLVTGSPLSILADPILPDPRGIGYEMGRALAHRLEVPMAPVLMPRPSEVLTALREQRVDVAFPALPAERMTDLAFTSAFMQVDLGYLVVAGVRTKYANDMDRAGLRIGVSMGGTAQKLLAAALRDASVVPVSSATSAAAMLASGRIDAFAADKPGLARMAESLPGPRVLEGRWGVERIAAAIHASREAGLAYVQKFVTEAERDGLVERAAQEAGLRGLVAPNMR
jgi:polar amino acid transport system substrate-binding protein